MHMVVHLLVQKRAQNDSIKWELEEALYVPFEGASKISLSQDALQTKKKCEEENAFEVVVDGPIDGTIMVHLRVHLKVHPRLHLAIYIKIFRKMHLRLYLRFHFKEP